MINVKLLILTALVDRSLYDYPPNIRRYVSNYS